MRSSPARTATLVAVPVALLTGVLAFWLLGGVPTGVSPGRAASGPVTVAAAALDERATTVCRALVAELPDAFGDRHRRPVTEGAEQNAAFGDPPIVLSCGIAASPVPQDADLWELSGVCWFAEKRADAQVWTTVDRQVPVRVTVPKAYDPPGPRVVELSEVIANAVPQADQACVDRSPPPSPR